MKALPKDYSPPSLLSLPNSVPLGLADQIGLHKTLHATVDLEQDEEEGGTIQGTPATRARPYHSLRSAFNLLECTRGLEATVRPYFQVNRGIGGLICCSWTQSEQ